MSATPPLIDELRELDRWRSDLPLRELHPDDDALARYGAAIGSAQAIDWAEQANRRPPELQTLDARGRRIDRVDFHPHWHRLLASLRGSGAIAAPFEPDGGWRRAAVVFYLHGQIEAGSLCPPTMTQAAIAVLARHAPSLYTALQSALHSRDHQADDAPLSARASLWLGMGMTEKQGGSDLRQVDSRAEPQPGQWHGLPIYRLNGHKWFFSAPMSDAHLVLARSAEGPSCFFVPRWRLDGSRLNGVQIQRLKDKLGNRSNSSAEVEFHHSEGLLIGAPGRGIALLAEMAGITRLQCIVGSTALMRAGLVQAVHWARHRHAFGRRLIEQALMRQVVADLALEWEAALRLMLRVAAAFERSEQDPVERAWQRVLTPAAKFWVCKRAIQHTGEAMEVLGGNGYVESGSLARLYREAPVNSIWEGSGNVMALDVLRAAQREAEPLQAWFDTIAPQLDPTERKRLQDLRSALFANDAEPQGRHLASELVLLAQAALLNDGMQNGIQNSATIAADFITTRLRQPVGVFGASPIANPDALLQRALPS